MNWRQKINYSLKTLKPRTSILGFCQIVIRSCNSTTEIPTFCFKYLTTNQSTVLQWLESCDWLKYEQKFGISIVKSYDRTRVQWKWNRCPTLYLHIPVTWLTDRQFYVKNCSINILLTGSNNQFWNFESWTFMIYSDKTIIKNNCKNLDFIVGSGEQNGLKAFLKIVSFYTQIFVI